MGLVINKSKDMTPFNMAEKPCKQYKLLLPLIWGGSWLLTRPHRLKIDKTNMEGINPPFLVIGTHQGPLDYYVGPLALFPHRGIYVSDMEGFAAFGKWLYRGLGCIGKRRYVSDITVIRNMKYALSMGQSVVVYPESRHSNVGTTAYIPKNMGKLAKSMGVPVVILHESGNYLANPFWDEEHTRKVPIEAKMTCLCNKSELERFSEEELQTLIEEALSYDDYKYQHENHILIKDKKRAEGLHKALYQCIKCKTKYEMQTKVAVLSCKSCGSSWELTEEGWLRENDRNNGNSEHNAYHEIGEKIHIPNWYNWQIENVRNELCDESKALDKKYNVHIYALPNEKGFVDLGQGKLQLDKAKFSLLFGDEEKRKLVREKNFDNYTINFLHKNRESVQTEYNYKGTGMCIVLSTNDCCYYIYSNDKDFNPTELQFIGEELYNK